MTHPDADPRTPPDRSSTVATERGDPEADLAITVLDLQVRQLTLRSAVHVLDGDLLPKALTDFLR